MGFFTTIVWVFIWLIILFYYLHLLFTRVYKGIHIWGGTIAQEKYQKIKSQYNMGIFILVLMTFAVPFVFPKPKEDPNAWKTKDNKTMAYTMMQEFVKDNLVSPASAKFEWISEPDCKISRNEHLYLISSWVDSQNSFGAMLRTQFEGAVEQVDEKNWNLRSLYMGDQRAFIDWNWVKSNKLGKITLYEFINNFKMTIKHFVSENADNYLNINYISEPVIIKTSRIGEYIIKIYVDDDDYIKNISFSYIADNTKYQSEMSTKVFLSFINAIEIFNTYEENENILKELYRNKTEELISFSGNRYSKNNDYPNYLYNVEINN